MAVRTENIAQSPRRLFHESSRSDHYRPPSAINPSCIIKTLKYETYSLDNSYLEI